ncbi:MAG: SlyX family protein [Gammaproteobacteria bacterium]
MIEDRLDEIEAKLALAEDLIDTLNQTVFRQQERIDLLQAELRLLYAQLQAQQPEDARPPREEIPPHY